MTHPFKHPDDLPEQIPVFDDESLEDLQRAGFRMIQKKKGFRFGTDSVLLAAYVAEHYKKTPGRSLTAGDFCAGSGSVSLLLAARLKKAVITGFELDPEACDVFYRNIRLNKLDHRMQIHQADLKTCFYTKKKTDRPEDCLSGFRHYFDLVMANPPYQKPERNFGYSDRDFHDPSLPDQDDQIKSAWWEAQLPLDNLVEAAACVIKQKGLFFMIHRAHRLPEVFDALSKYRFTPVNLRLVQPLRDRAPFVFLITARYLGKKGGFRAAPALVLYDSPGQLSHQAAVWYGHESPMSEDLLWQNVKKAKNNHPLKQ